MLPIISKIGAYLKWPSILGSQLTIGPLLSKCEMEAIRLWVCRKFVVFHLASTTKTKCRTMADQFNNTI